MQTLKLWSAKFLGFFLFSALTSSQSYTSNNIWNSHYQNPNDSSNARRSTIIDQENVPSSNPTATITHRDNPGSNPNESPNFQREYGIFEFESDNEEPPSTKKSDKGKYISPFDCKVGEYKIRNTLSSKSSFGHDQYNGVNFHNLKGNNSQKPGTLTINKSEPTPIPLPNSFFDEAEGKYVSSENFK